MDYIHSLGAASIIAFTYPRQTAIRLKLLSRCEEDDAFAKCPQVVLTAGWRPHMQLRFATRAATAVSALEGMNFLHGC